MTGNSLKKMMDEKSAHQIAKNVTVLSFVSTAEKKQVEIDDGLGNVVSVPSKGAADCVEYNKVMQFMYRMEKDPTQALGMEVAIVTLCLRHRYKLAKDVTDDSVLLGKDGEPVPISLVKKLYEFFMKELQLEKILDAQKMAVEGRKPVMQMENAAPYLE
jgi:hypothetical protein